MPGPDLRSYTKVIVAVFYNGLEPVRRKDARKIISDNYSGDPLVPLNFFFYNRIINASDYFDVRISDPKRSLNQKTTDALIAAHQFYGHDRD